MNEKPQEARDEQEDLLEQIITQGLDQMKAPAQATAVEEAPAEVTPSSPRQKEDGTASPPANGKNRRSSVYLYLLVLFGAAFLMLLLAYFIQQRSSEYAISDLRDSMNLSRTELLAEIRELEEANSALNERLSQWERYGEESQKTIDLWNQEYTAALEELYAWQSFWDLERYYQAGDHESCAAVLLLMSQYGYRIPDGALGRYDEIVPALIDEGILAGDYSAHISDYDELIDAFLAEHTISVLSMGC